MNKRERDKAKDDYISICKYNFNINRKIVK